MTDEIINGNPKNIGYNAKKAAVSALERESKVFYDLMQKNYVGRFLKHQFILNTIA